MEREPSGFPFLEINNILTQLKCLQLVKKVVKPLFDKLKRPARAVIRAGRLHIIGVKLAAGEEKRREKTTVNGNQPKGQLPPKGHWL